MADERMPKEGDYWCMGLLTDDFLEAVNHAARYAQEHQETVTVSRYVSVGGWAPSMKDVAVIRSPQTTRDHMVAAGKGEVNGG